MKTPTTLLLLLCSTFLVANVNPTRGGRTWMECISGTTYELNVEVNISGAPLSSDSVHIDWGDGNEQAVAMTDWTSLFSYTNYTALHFALTHTFSYGNYSIVIRAGKRLPGISNISFSDTTDFILLNEIVIDPNIGCNSSPVEAYPPPELEWNTGMNNINALYFYDVDGDSMAYSLIPIFGPSGSGYQMPDAVGGGTFTFAPNYQWNPQQAGLYTVVYLCEEYVTLQNGNTMIKGVTTTEILIDVDNVNAVAESTTPTISFYPNPATSHLQLSEAVSLVMISDVEGRIVLAENNADVVDVSGLSEGVYIIWCEGLATGRIVIAR